MLGQYFVIWDKHPGTVIKIEFIGNTAGVRRRVKLMNPSGGGDGYHVYIANYYYGTIRKLKGQWIGHMNAKSDLSSTHIERLGAIIEEYEGGNTLS